MNEPAPTCDPVSEVSLSGFSSGRGALFYRSCLIVDIVPCIARVVPDTLSLNVKRTSPTAD